MRRGRFFSSDPTQEGPSGWNQTPDSRGGYRVRASKLSFGREAVRYSGRSRIIFAGDALDVAEVRRLATSEVGGIATFGDLPLESAPLRGVGRSEGRKVGRSEGRKVGRSEGRKVGRSEGRMPLPCGWPSCFFSQNGESIPRPTVIRSGVDRSGRRHFRG
jgi:hypothetical protein